MDKEVMKRLLREAGIPTPKFLVFRKASEAKFEAVRRELGPEIFVKPANLGSSIGVSRVRTKREFNEAIREAFRYDCKVLAEEGIRGREIECAVLGNEKPVASVPGEIIPHSKHGFYSYEAKYLDENGALLRIPAELPKSLAKKARELAVKTFKALNCEGMGRVDMFLTRGGKFLVNEINTIPGFTKISMYPKLWQASGISYPELIDRLIQLALERHAKESKLKISYL
jgi:D-alanine-D-alanine ligase